MGRTRASRGRREDEGIPAPPTERDWTIAGESKQVGVKMRDPKRIQKVLKVIEGVWKQYPDLRLGQLLENAGVDNGDCIFYLEDGDLVLALLEFVGHGNKKTPRTGLSKVTLRKLSKVVQQVGQLIKLEARRERGKRNPKRRTFLGSGYKFPECLMPGGGKTGYGDSKVGKRKKRKGKK